MAWWRASGAALALLLALPACADGKDGDMSGPGADGSARDELTISVSSGSGQEPTTWTLTCDPPGGTHPDPEAACRTLATVRAPFAPVPAGMGCTQVYGGPETATITGTWAGRPVTASYKRTDGCEIARWRKLGPVLSPSPR